MKLASILVILLACGLSSFATGQTIEKKGMTLETAKRVIAVAVAEAKSRNAPGAAIAVVDEGGNLVAVERLDNTFAAGANISIGKARTAALFKRPTKVFEDIINKGRTAMATLNDFTPLQGGVPITVDGQIVGAIGVSGAASAQQDEDLAVAGANALATSSARAQ
jgi:glc operon protein GlcG